jgi:hypothetical protein
MNDKILLRRLAVAAFLETLNRNFKSCIFYLSEISRLLKKNYKLDEDENIFVSFASGYVNSEKWNNEEYLVDLHKSINDLQNSFKDYFGIQTEFEKEGTPEALKFHCSDYGYFFSIREEFLPVNINNQVVSTYNGKIIKGRIINIKNILNLSSSQALEWFKFNSVGPILDELILFIPY